MVSNKGAEVEPEEGVREVSGKVAGDGRVIGEVVEGEDAVSATEMWTWGRRAKSPGYWLPNETPGGSELRSFLRLPTNWGTWETHSTVAKVRSQSLAVSSNASTSGSVSVGKDKDRRSAPSPGCRTFSLERQK